MHAPTSERVEGGVLRAAEEAGAGAGSEVGGGARRKRGGVGP